MPAEKIPSGYKKFAVDKYDEPTMGLYNRMQEQVGADSWLQRLAGGDQSMFEEMEAPAMRQFNQMIGENASRFSGMGMGARRGSGFQNSTNQATSDFAQDLQSKRMDYMRQSMKDLGEIFNMLTGNQAQETGLVKKPEKQGFDWNQMANTVVKQGMKTGADYFLPGSGTVAQGAGII